MFGYIQVYKDELKYREYSLYRHHYCELCRNMGSYSLVSRIFLSYDITFLLLLGNPVSPVNNCCKKCNLIACRSIRSEGLYDFFAALSIALIYHKFNNDVVDKAFMKRFPRMLVKRAYKATQRRHPEIGRVIERGLAELVELEKSNCCDYVDMSNRFAKTISDACSDFFETYGDKAIRLGIIERVVQCVYLLDIIDDVEHDFKKKDYNPLNIIANGKAGELEIAQCRDAVIEILSQAYSLSELLPYSDCNSIITNVISLGIPSKLEEITTPKK